jgi:hypothetical protein
MEITACPICRSNDRIQKVSGVYREGISKLTGVVPTEQVYTGSDGKIHSFISSSNVTFTQQTELARRLAPPNKPTPPTNWWGMFKPFFYFGLVINILVIFPIPFVIWGFISGPKFFATKEAEYLGRKQHFDTLELPKWELAMQRWDSLYYCFRDDKVFYPGATQMISFNLLSEYLMAN